MRSDACHVCVVRCSTCAWLVNAGRLSVHSTLLCRSRCVALLHHCIAACNMVYVACTMLQVVDTGALDFEEPFAVRLLDFCDDRISDNVLFLKLRRFIHSGEPT